MGRLQDILEYYADEEFLIADGFDEAIVGVDAVGNRIVYSIEVCYEILMERDDMSYEEAIEYMDFNVINAFVGDKTPIFIYTFENQ